ncbi:MAG: hypothetical protein OEY01_14170 [Desulfobulbaceae bacterium]|nr:hypothetical protein [Desulfobulbaceae bacterium]
MNKALTIFIGFLHDFAAGCWLATVAGVYWLDRFAHAPELGAALFDLKRRFFYMGLVCIALVFASGAGRTFTYVDNVYGEDSERRRRKMLIIKHIVLLIVFGGGALAQYLMVFG